MDTLIFALADLYAKETSSSIEALPVSESSRFVNFMDSCLSPLYRDADLAGALGRRWRDMRKAVRALPSAISPQIDAPPHSVAGQIAEMACAR